jgi:hypothetical protein
VLTHGALSAGKRQILPPTRLGAGYGAARMKGFVLRSRSIVVKGP